MAYSVKYCMDQCFAIGTNIKLVDLQTRHDGIIIIVNCRHMLPMQVRNCPESRINNHKLHVLIYNPDAQNSNNTPSHSPKII